jgi:sarcosine oxidase
MTTWRGRSEVAVVGAGVVGLATTDALMRRGADVACFEKALVGRGQSAGATRTFRQRHHDPALVQLASAAREGWTAWERRAARELLGHQGLLALGPGPLQEARRLSELGVRCDLVSADEARWLFPGLADDGSDGVFEPDAGAIRARETIDVLAGWVEPSLVQAEVVGLREESGRVALQTSEGFWECQRVIICAGLASPSLAASAGLDVSVRITCHARPTFRIVANAGVSWPCLQDLSERWGEQAYGSVASPGKLYAVGLRRGSELPVVRGEQAVADADMRELVRRTQSYVARALPGLDPDPVAVQICFTTRLPASHDGFELSRSERVTVLVGHNLFKFAPALGELLAEAAITGREPRRRMPRGGFMATKLTTPTRPYRPAGF